MRSLDEYRQVAQLHASLINQGFLPTLGVPFLTLLYEAIDRSPQGALFTLKADGRVVGFVAGTTRMGAIYRELLRSWWRLSLALLPSLFSPTRVWKILEILTYGRSRGQELELPGAELLSIAVDPGFRGARRADQLYLQLMECFRKQGQRSFKIVVGASLEPAHRFYRRMGATPATTVEVHRGSSSTIYVHQL